MPTKNNPIESISMDEWGKFIGGIIRPFSKFCHNNAMISREDLEQEAWLSLLYAAKKFDVSRGAKFTTYAYYNIRGAILRYITKKIRYYDYLDESNDFSYIDEMLDKEDFIRVTTNLLNDQKHAYLLEEYFIKNKPYREIAKEQNVSHQLIFNRITKLVELLRLRLNEQNS